MGQVNPRVDLAFKKIFGTEDNKDLLISLINSIVSEEDQVIDVTLLNPYNQREFQNDRLSILDIKAEDHRGKKFNIEIQITDEADYDKRALYYWAKLYTGQLQQAQDYTVLNKVIGIHIMNFTAIPSIKKYHNVFRIREDEEELIYFKDLELHTIELKKFEDVLGEGFEGLVSKIRNALDVWSAFLTRHDLLDPNKLMGKLNVPALRKAIQVLEVMNLSQKEREAYEDRLKWLRIETSGLKKAEEKGRQKGWEEGRQEGREEGRQEGREEGRQEGREEGREEGEQRKAIQIALKMLGRNRPMQEIMEDTGLSESAIKSLQK